MSAQRHRHGKGGTGPTPISLLGGSWPYLIPAIRRRPSDRRPWIDLGVHLIGRACAEIEIGDLLDRIDVRGFRDSPARSCRSPGSPGTPDYWARRKPAFSLEEVVADRHQSGIDLAEAGEVSWPRSNRKHWLGTRAKTWPRLVDRDTRARPRARRWPGSPAGP